MTLQHPLSAATYNLLYNEADGIYDDYAKRFKLSQTALFLLCTLYENDEPPSQRQLASEWHFPPQTINSILKRFVREDLVRLEDMPADRRSKRVVLTEAGRRYAQGIVGPLIEAEERAFSRLSADEQKALLTLTEKYLTHLRDAIDV